jgi:hypothetical protein
VTDNDDGDDGDDDDDDEAMGVKIDKHSILPFRKTKTVNVCKCTSCTLQHLIKSGFLISK